MATGNLFDTFKSMRLEHPEAPAFLIASGDRYLSIPWRQFTDDIAAVCCAIGRHLEHPVVGILGENSYEWMVAHAACLFSNGTAVPIDLNLSAEEISRRLRFVGASMLVHSSLYADLAHEVAALTPGLATGGFGTRKTDFLLDAVSLVMRTPGVKTVWDGPGPDRLRTSMIVFTSGTTSEPLGVELTIAAIEAFARSVEDHVPFEFGKRSLMLLPLYHIFGIATVYLMLMRGVALGVCPDFRRIYDAFERFRVNFAFLVPALADLFAARIAQRGRSAEEALGQQIDWIITGGAPLPRRTYEHLNALGVKTLSGYGLTETCALYSMPDMAEDIRPCSGGRAISNEVVQTRVSPTGELQIRGECVLKRYYRAEAETAAAFTEDGWFRTGDLGRIDEDGYVWITGRASRTIVLSSGKKIAPEELEEKLLALPGVIEALVSGEGECRTVRAEVFASVGEESVRRSIDALNRILPVFKRISTVVVRTEPFPRTSSGKIRLGGLRR